jgi:sugar phosphate isomerase/epimerase
MLSDMKTTQKSVVAIDEENDRRELGRPAPGVRRREFLSRGRALAVSLGLGMGPSLSVFAREVKLSTPAAAELGWRTSVQHYTYRRYGLFEALDKAAALGLRHIEVRSNVKLDAKQPGMLANEDMPADARQKLKSMLAERGMSIPSMFADFNGSPDQAKRVFEFCKELGATIIVAEPPADAFDTIERLCEEYRMPLAIHNHQKGQSQYWSPDLVLAACRNRSSRLGACCDGGQWARSGLDPVACLRQLQGRIISFHLKDVVKKGDPQSRNTVIGEGEADCAKTLKELRRLRYQGLITIDFEYDTPALQEDMARNVAFIEEQAKQLLAP